MSHLEVGHEVSEDRRTLLFQQALQADDKRNCVLYESFLLDLWIQSRKLRVAPLKAPQNFLMAFNSEYFPVGSLHHQARVLTAATYLQCQSCIT